MMTGGAITARQALDWGLLWRLLPEATLVDEVIRLAERLARVFPYCHKQLDDPSVGIRPREESVSRRARPSGPSHNGARFAGFERHEWGRFQAVCSWVVAGG